MSNLPAWKRALLEKKKQQEQQEELKKQQEQEAYLKSLPPWKRAIVIRDMEKGKSSPTTARKATGNAPTSPKPPAAHDKWKAALSQSNKTSSTSAPEKTESPARTRVTWGGAGGGVRALVVNENKDSGKPSWVREKSPTPPAAESIPVANNSSLSTGDAPSPRTIIREQRRGSVQTLKDQFKSGSPPPSTFAEQESKPAAESAAPQRKREITPPQQQVKKEPSPQPATTPAPSPAPAVQVDDSDLGGLPSWKRALILKKRQKQAGIVPGAIAQPQNGSADKASTPAEASETSSSKSPETTKKVSTTKSRPDVVNRAGESENPGSNKLVQKEGVTLHPPIFNEVGQWANVAADDPKFTQLPQWKQALILRRRKDIAKRSGQETSPPDSPTIKTAAEKRRASSSGSSSQAETKKGNKRATTKSTGKTEGKKTSSKTKAAEEKKTTTKSSNKSKAKSSEEKTAKTIKANATSNKAKSGSTAGKHGSGGIKPVRAAPTKPPEKKQEEEKKEEEEPMFTWNFSKNSMDTGDAMSNSSDSELEDVQITSIDDELSDEDDSGIGGSGGTILKSYKPLADTSEIEERRENSVTPERKGRSVTPERKERSVTPERKEKGVSPERSMSNSTSDPAISKMPRSESKSILIDPAKKPHRVSKVRPSSPFLAQE